jgi:hypothetical protein
MLGFALIVLLSILEGNYHEYRRLCFPLDQAH